MKTLKIMLYILLTLTVFLMIVALIGYLVIPEIRENLLLDAYSIPPKLIERHTIMVTIELVLMVVCSVASLISTIVNWKKPHGGYYAGTLLSVPYILCVVLVRSANRILGYMVENYYNFYPVFRYFHVLALEILAWVLFVTMATLLLDGFLQTRRHERKVYEVPAGGGPVAAQPKEGCHLVIDLGIRGLLCVYEKVDKFSSDPTTDHSTARPSGGDLVAILQSSLNLSLFIRPAMDLKHITNDRTGQNKIVPPALVIVVPTD